MEERPDAVQGRKHRLASHKLWIFLLVLDGVAVIFFGGTVAARIYKHWAAPTPPPTEITVRPKYKPAAKKAAKPEKKKEEPKKEAPKAEKKAPAPKKKAEKAKKPPKPAKAAKKAPPAKKVRARPIEFRVRASGAKKVELAGAFLVRTGGVKAMERKSGGVWALTVYLKPEETYRYSFIIDGKKSRDPQNPRKSGKVSVITIP